MRLRAGMTAAACIAATGCGVVLLPPYPRGAMLSPAAAEVVLVDVGSSVPAECTVLGDVRGRGVDDQRAVARSGATREIRNAAAALGATHVRIERESVKPGSHHGWIWHTRDEVTLRGRALRCH